MNGRAFGTSTGKSLEAGALALDRDLIANPDLSANPNMTQDAAAPQAEPVGARDPLRSGLPKALDETPTRLVLDIAHL
jgi:hypothetical protein